MKLKTIDTYSKPYEELPCGSGTAYKPGLGLYISSGVAALATGTNKPTHICDQKKTGVTGEYVTAVRITKDMTFEAELAASGTTLAVGDLVTMHTDADKITATTTSGVAEIVAFPEGKAQGAKVVIKF